MRSTSTRDDVVGVVVTVVGVAAEVFLVVAAAGCALAARPAKAAGARDRAGDRPPGERRDAAQPGVAFPRVGLVVML